MRADGSEGLTLCITMCLQSECLSEEGLEFLEGSFIARNRLQLEANRVLHEAENRRTEIALLFPFDALVVVKKVELHEVLLGSSRVKFFKVRALLIHSSLHTKIYFVSLVLRFIKSA